MLQLVRGGTWQPGFARHCYVVSYNMCAMIGYKLYVEGNLRLPPSTNFTPPFREGGCGKKQNYHVFKNSMPINANALDVSAHVDSHTGRTSLTDFVFNTYV